MVETADREKAETEYARQIEELEIRRDEELGPLKEKLITEEEQVTLFCCCTSFHVPLYACSKKKITLAYNFILREISE